MSWQLVLKQLHEGYSHYGRAFVEFEQHVSAPYLSEFASGPDSKRVAEKAEPDEESEKLAERQRRAFNRAVKATSDNGEINTTMIDDRRFLWVPGGTGTDGTPQRGGVPSRPAGPAARAEGGSVLSRKVPSRPAGRGAGRDIGNDVEEDDDCEVFQM
jgi:hypothetical protein